MGEYAQSSTQPEVYRRSTGDLEVVSPNQPEVYSKPDPDDKRYFYNQQDPPPGRRRVCGVTPLVFWILVLTSVLLLAAGLGAGLGAGLSKKNSNDKAEYVKHLEFFQILSITHMNA